MEGITETLRKRILLLSIISVVIGILVPICIVLLTAGYDFNINPIVNIVRCARVGFPIKAILILSIALIIISSYFVVRVWKGTVYEDPLGRTLTHSDTDSYGSARFAKEEEYREYAPVRRFENCTGQILGQRLDRHNDKTNHYIDFHPEVAPLFNGHKFVVGASGSGKSSCLVKPYLVQIMKRRESAMVTDPKGEMYIEMSEMFRKEGYEVRVLDLINQRKSDGWDPIKTLVRLDPDNLEQKVDVFAHTMISNFPPNNNAPRTATKALIKAMLLYILLNDNYTAEQKSIKKFKELLAIGDIKTYAGMFESCIGKMAPAKRAYDEFKTASEKLYGNIFLDAQVNTDSLSTDTISNILCTDDIDMTHPGDKPCVYFCRFPVTNSAYQFIIALFISTMFEVMFAQAEKNGGSLHLPVHFILDEFANIGELPNWNRAMSVIRSYNITATMIVQDYTQFSKNYPAMDVTIRANCATILCMGVNDEVSAKLLAERIGEMTQELRTSPEDDKGHKKDQVNVGLGKRMFLSPTEIQELDKYTELIIFQRQKPVVARKVHISKFPEAKNIPEADIKGKPDITDLAGRAAYWAADAERQRNYLIEHANDPVVEYDHNALVEMSPSELADKPFLSLLFFIYGKELEALKHSFIALFKLLQEKTGIIITINRKKKAEDKPSSEESEEQPATTSSSPEKLKKVERFAIELDDLDDTDTGEEESPKQTNADEPAASNTAPDNKQENTEEIKTEKPEEKGSTENEVSSKAPEQPKAENSQKQKEQKSAQESKQKTASVEEILSVDYKLTNIEKCHMCNSDITEIERTRSIKKFGIPYCANCFEKFVHERNQQQTGDETAFRKHNRDKSANSRQNKETSMPPGN